MDLESARIGAINKLLTLQIQNVNNYINQKYKKIVDQYEDSRFQTLQQCLKNRQGQFIAGQTAPTNEDSMKLRKDLTECIRQYDSKQILVDFETPNKTLGTCVNQIFGIDELEKGKTQQNKNRKSKKNAKPQSESSVIQKCIQSYRNTIELSLKRELGRLSSDPLDSKSKQGK